MGEHGAKLAEMAGSRPLAYIPNALDAWSSEDTRNTRVRNEEDLKKLNISFEQLDLRDFFSDKSQLESQISRFAGVWVTGGNTFVLRQAMKLAGFDEALTKLLPTSFIYGGYSAGVCVLAPRLDALQIVDEPNKFPYPRQTEVIWEGLNLLNYIILPHYKSEHPESADIDREVDYCQANGIAYRTLRDGEVIFGEDINVLRRSVALNP